MGSSGFIVVYTGYVRKYPVLLYLGLYTSADSVKPGWDKGRVDRGVLTLIRTRKRYSTVYILMAISFVPGLTAKPMLVTLPFALLVLDFWPLKRFTLEKMYDLKSSAFTGCVKEKLSLFVFSILFVIINLSNVKVEQTSPLTVLSFSARVANALVSYSAYLGKLFFPVNLSILYPHSYPDPIPLWQVACAALLLIALTTAAVKLIKKAPYAFTGWLWYLGILVPVIGLTRTGTQAMADRFLYVPAIGIYIIAVRGLSDLIRAAKIKLPATATLVSLVVITLFVMTRHQQSLYRSSIPIFQHTLAHTKNNHIIHNNLGLVLLDQGKTDKAYSHFKKAVTINPKNEFAWNNLGTWYAKKDSLKSALYCFWQALEIRTDYSSVYYNLGSVYERMHIDSFAVVFYEKYLTYRPDHMSTLKSLGNLYISHNSPERALRVLKKALKMEPKSSTIHNALAMAYERLGDPNRAMKHYITALENDPSAWQTYNNFGLLLLHQNDLFNAAKSFTEAIKLRPKSEMPFINRGRAYLAAKMVPLAKNDFLTALKMNPNSIPAHGLLSEAYSKLGIIDSAALHKEIAEGLKEKYNRCQ